MKFKQFKWSKSRLVSFVSATVLLILTALPTLASNDPGRPDDQPIRCCVVVPGDQGMYSNDCFGPGEFPGLPLFITQTQDPAQLTEPEEAVRSTYRAKAQTIDSARD